MEWWDDLPDVIRYSIPTILAGIFIILFKIVVFTLNKIADKITSYIFFNAIGFVGTIVGATLLGFSKETESKICFGVGTSVFCLSLLLIFGYNFYLWIRWCNNWGNHG